jgi:hypothetical protein
LPDTTPLLWVMARVALTEPPEPPEPPAPEFVPPPPPPAPATVTVADTVPTGGVAVTYELQLSPELHDAATGVVVAPAGEGDRVELTSAVATDSMPAIRATTTATVAIERLRRGVVLSCEV